jgi:hypothetical protein
LLTDDEWIEMAKAHGIDATRLSTVMGFARAVERAAREEAIRECAKACQSIANNTDWVDRFRDGAAECADVLRALLEGS